MMVSTISNTAWVISNTAWAIICDCPFGKDGGLKDVELQTSICLEDGLELSQNL
jgi:hypothetical protein